MNALDDWAGPLDPDNPRNFPLSIRIFSIVSTTTLAFVSSFSGTIYAPAQDDVMTALSCTYEASLLPLSLFNLGLAIGPLIGAPLSEHYGRKSVFVLTTLVFILFLLGGSFAKDITALCICRLIAGVFAAPNVNNASALILDYSEVRYRGVNIGVYYSVPSMGASLGPLVGGFVMQATEDWRWTQWTAIIIAIVCWIPLLFTRETYKKVILRRRAIRLGLSDQSSQQTSKSKALHYFFTVLIRRPLHMLLTEPIVTFVSLYNGLIFGLLYTFVTCIPWIFQHYYGFNRTGESLSFLGASLGTLIACGPFVLMDFLFYQKKLHKWNDTHDQCVQPPPETRLVSALPGSILLPISLFIAGWTAHYRIHWAVPIMFQGVAMMSCLLVYAGVSIFVLDSYGPLYGASASGAMMLARYSMSFAFPMFALRMFESLGVGWATSVLGFLTLVMAPIPWCFWVFGERLRRKSKYETSL